MINNVFAAMDFNDHEEFIKNYLKIKDDISLFKIGYQLFYSVGDRVMKFLEDEGKIVFLDLKFSDIPNTMEKGLLSLLKRYRFNYFTVHLSGANLGDLGAIAKESEVALLGVTVLTSINESDLKKTGVSNDIKSVIRTRIEIAKENCLSGIIISADDIKDKDLKLQGLIKVCPGIRYAEESQDDQKRITDPKHAFENGADKIVMGRSLFKHGVEKLKGNLYG